METTCEQNRGSEAPSSSCRFSSPPPNLNPVDMHTTAGVLLNLDVCAEIIRHYRFNMLDDDDTSKAKKAALRSLALVSRRLAPLAQSEMWRTVYGTRHVTEYIKHIEGSNLIQNVTPNILWQPLQAKVIERVQKMLSYTKHVILGKFTEVIFSDWEFIQMATGQSHLFKNLESVDIDWNTCRGCENGQMIVPFLASPGLKYIVHRKATVEDEAVLLLFHSMLRMHNAPIASVRLSKTSYLSPGIISRMLHSASPQVFVTIQIVRLPQQGRIASWYLALASCPNLTSLQVYEGAENPTCWDYSKNEVFRLENLQLLEIDGRIQHFSLLRQLDCPTLGILALRLLPFPGSFNIFSSISHFVRLESVHISIRKAPNNGPPFLRLENLRPVLDSLPTLRYLAIIGVTSLLTETDVKEIFTMRPSLWKLVIYGPSSYALHPSVLCSIAEHQVRKICLPIDFSSIMSLTIPPIGASNSPLIHFFIPECVSLPESMQEKLHLVEFIYRMFPEAKIAPHQDTEMSKAVEDLEIMRAHYSKVSKVASSR